MKTHEIKGGNSHRQPHAQNPTTDLGPVARMRSRDMPPGGRRPSRRGERHGNPERKRRVLLLSLLLGGGTLAVLGGAVLFWLLPQLERKSESVALAGAFSLSPPAANGEEFPPPPKETAIRLVKQAMEVRDVARVPEFFRMGSASARDIVSFLQGTEARDGILEEYEWIGTMNVGDLPVEGVLLNFQGTDRRGQRIAYLTPDAQGVWKVDFDACARSTVPPWREVKKGATEAVARVFVGPDFYYNGAFAEEREWQSFKLSSPDLEPDLYGYCKRGTAVQRDLITLLEDRRGISRATLEIRRVEGGGPRQFEITNLLAGDWIIPDAAVEPAIPD